MRLQLDSTTAGSELARTNEAPSSAPVSGSGYDSRRIGGGSTSSDSIRISGPSSALSSMASERTARIQQLTAQVQAGTYDVAGSQISEAIVGHALTWAGSEA